VRNGILTFSGRFVPSDEPGDIPSITDIGRSLARMPRFAGYCRRPWSVADHSLFCAELGFTTESGDATARVLACLLHDAHESITGDIARPFKTKDMARLQSGLDAEIYNEYHPKGSAYRLAVDLFIDRVDHRALLAEALIVGPPCLSSPYLVEEYFGEKPAPADVTFLAELLQECELGQAPEIMQQRFLDKYYELTRGDLQ
jgi:HD domain